ncbi:MAG: choice-of-anchor D domain-containing protein [Akkermansiaceae bacterium]|nr:choice-of-anchor D domain-containing protein [Verrucomicrobiales bacterium]
MNRIKQNLLLAVWMAGAVAFVSTASTALAAETTLVFSSTDSAAWSDYIAEDGNGGSINISAKTILFYNITDTSGTLLNEVLLNGHASQSDGFDLLTTYGLSVQGSGWKGMEIRSQDGSEFQLNGFYYSNYGESSPITITVKGFRNTVEVASTSFVTAFDATAYQSKVVTLDSTFDNVDDVRLYYSGTTWHGINSIKIDDAVLPAVPEIAVLGNGSSIPNGSTSYSSANFTDFGSTNASSGSMQRTFSVTNSGNGTLNLSGSPRVTVSGATSDFSVAVQPSASVSAGGVTTFTVTFDPTAIGNRIATLSIANNDSDENPFTFNVRGTGLQSAPTDITLSAGSVNQSGGVNATVGTLSSTDIDSGAFTYTLVSGTGSTDNGSFNISGSTLRANNAAALASGNFSVRIQSDDGSGGTYAEAFTITVVDDIATAAPASFAANATGSNVSLTWVNPVAADFASTTIRRSSISFPTSINDGTLLAQGLTGTSRSDNSLADGTYYYAIFALDGSANVSPAATASVTVDTTAPTVSIGSPSASITAGGPVNYTVTYSGQDSISLTALNITVNSTGSAAANTITISGSGNTRTVSLSDLTGNGTLSISIAAGTASDTAGNQAPAAGPGTTFTVDNTDPTVSISAPSASITQNGPVTFTLTWADANFDSGSISLLANQVILNTTGNVSVGAISVFGSGSTRTVDLDAITGSGTIGISIPAGTASDQAGNQTQAAGPSATFIVNASPTLAVDNAAVTIGEGSPATNTGTFTDADGNATASLSASAGSLTPNNGAGTWSWSLNTTDGPEDSQTVTLTIQDGVATNTTSFTLTVTNLAPGAIAQSITTPEDVATNITLNATDPGSDTITSWVVTVSPTNGVLSGTAPNLVYTPATNFNGGDSFKFTATDSDGGVSVEATVSLTVTAINDPPVAGADGIARPNSGRTAKVTKAALLANDTDPDGDTLTLSAVGNPTPSGATVVMAGNFVIYTAPGTNSGDGSFTYTLSDGAGGHTVTNVVSVTEVASTPTAAGPNSAAIAASGSDFILTFIGVPGRQYRVQYTTSVSSPYTWTEFSPLAVYTAPANGVFTHTDVNPPNPIRLYRAVPHP